MLIRNSDKLADIQEILEKKTIIEWELASDGKMVYHHLHCCM